MKRLLLLLPTIFIFFLSSSVAFSAVTIEMGDVFKNEFFVTYSEITNSRAGATYGDLVGFPSEAKVEILQVHDENTDQDLKAELFDGEAGKGIRYHYIHPIPETGSITVTIRLKLTNQNQFYGDENKITVNYRTTHSAYIILPIGYAAVYCNKPVLIYEKKGKTVLSYKGGKDSKVREIIISAKKLAK